jgi:exodeoxyribonuclease-3
MQLKIYSWNVNGIRSAERKGFSAWLAASNADIVAVQETKARPEQLVADLRDPPGYHAAWLSAEKAGYSGVATFSRQLPLSERRGIGDARFDGEGRVLISEFAALTFINCYFPSGSAGPHRVEHKLAFYAALTPLVNAYLAEGRSLVLVGDLNTCYAPIDLARPRENMQTSGFLPEERLALGQLYAAGLVDSLRQLYPERVAYSWWSQRVMSLRERNIGWRLDSILVSADLAPRIVAAETHPEVLGSDHCPVSVVLDL